MDAVNLLRQIIFSTTKYTKDTKKSKDLEPFVIFVVFVVFVVIKRFCLAKSRNLNHRFPITAAGIGKTAPHAHHLTNSRDDQLRHVQPRFMDAVNSLRQIIFPTTKDTKDTKKSKDLEPFVIFVVFVVIKRFCLAKSRNLNYRFLITVSRVGKTASRVRHLTNAQDITFSPASWMRSNRFAKSSFQPRRTRKTRRKAKIQKTLCGLCAFVVVNHFCLSEFHI